jgi:hypothetical protein
VTTTQELIRMLDALAFTASSDEAPEGWWTRISIDDLRAAASRLTEMEGEIKRLREALKPFADPRSFLGNVTDDDVQNARDVLGITTARRIGSRATLEHDKGEPKP